MKIRRAKDGTPVVVGARDYRKSRRFCGARASSLGASGFFSSSGIVTFYLPQHFLYFIPLPQGQGSFRPILRPR